MQNSQQNNKRIAKNTMMLYIRMFFMMVVQLYTSRIVLNSLGIEDFGLYNVVGGIVVLFSILNSALTGSTQRFINFEIGKKDGNVTQLFKCCLSLYCILLIVILILSETLGLWYVNSHLKVPEGRMFAANCIYQFSILLFCLNVLKTPFNAAIIAYEKMSFYAYLGIGEAIAKLAVAFLILYTSSDKLIVYGFFLMLIGLFVFVAYYVYVHRKMPYLTIRLCWDKDIVLQMTSFSGWNLFGAFAVISSQQGTNLLLNYFFGVTLNAAAGIANQVTNAMYGFISNFQTAFNPQIIQLYAKNNLDEFYRLVFRASRFSFFLFWVIALPVMNVAEPLLELWLGIVPKHTESFCRIIIVYLLIDAINGPLWTSVNATGKIKKYQIGISFILLLNIPIIYIFLLRGYSPEIAWGTRVFFNFCVMIFRIAYLKRIMVFPILKYMRESIFPIAIVVLLTIPLLFIGVESDNLWMKVILNAFCCVILSSIVIFVFGFKRKERKFIVNKILKNKIE